MRVRLVKELTEVANKHFNTVEKDTKSNMSSIDAYLNKMLEKFSLLPMFMETMILQFSKDPNSKCAGTRDPKVMKKVSADALKDPKKDGPAGAVSTSGGPPDGSNSTGKGPDAAKPVIPKDEKAFAGNLPAVDKKALKEANKMLKEMANGITTLGAFWIMLKIDPMLADKEKIKPPTKLEVEKSLMTVYRYSMASAVYSSNEFLNHLEVILKGAKKN